MWCSATAIGSKWARLCSGFERAEAWRGRHGALASE
jgi:hypothetical protein